MFPQVFVTNLQFDQVRFSFSDRCFHFFGTVNGVEFQTETYRTGFQKKDQGERGGTLRGNDIFFRKSVSQTFNMFKLDFFSESPRFPFVFVVSSPHNRQLGPHTNGVRGRPEAPGSKVLPL